MAHRRIAVMGHSQRGMSMRWALRFWPDTRPMVKDVIGFAGANHGTTVGCQCPEASRARRPKQIPKSVCTELYMSGVNPANLNAELEILEGAPGLLGVAVGPVAGKNAPSLTLSDTRSRSGIRVLVRAREGYRLVPVPGATVTAAGHRVKTGGDGRAVVPVQLVGHRAYRLSASRGGCNPATVAVR